MIPHPRLHTSVKFEPDRNSLPPAIPASLTICLVEEEDEDDGGNGLDAPEQ